MGRRRGENKPQKGSGWAQHHSADAAISLGDLPHEDALGRGEIISDGGMLRISQETLPEGKP